MIEVGPAVAQPSSTSAKIGGYVVLLEFAVAPRRLATKSSAE